MNELFYVYASPILITVGLFFLLVGKIILDRTPPDVETYEGDSENDFPRTAALFMLFAGGVSVFSGIMYFARQIM